MPRALPDRRAAVVLLLLFTGGWGANHFAAALPVLAEREGTSDAVLAAVYGLYAAGLLPGLLLGGGLSDRIGRARVALPGAALAICGTLVLAVWHDPAGLALGRIVVGLGSGAVFSAGTAWSTDLGGAGGSVRAGVVLTSGFALGPVATGTLAVAAPAPLLLPFLVSAVLSGGAIAAVLAVGRRGPRPVGEEEAAHEPASAPAPHPAPADASVARALGWALPIAPWVFVATVGIVTVPARLGPSAIPEPLVAGLAGALSLGVGIIVQQVARRRGLGPGVGALGAATTGVALLLLAAAGARPGLLVAGLVIALVGVGYGGCLRAGLLDVQTYAPPARRGLVTGAFYVATYLGFATPFALEVLAPTAGLALPPLVLGLVALLVAGQRAVRLRRAGALARA